MANHGPTANGGPGKKFWVALKDNATKPKPGTRSVCGQEVFPGNFPIFENLHFAGIRRRFPASAKGLVEVKTHEFKSESESDDNTTHPKSPKSGKPKPMVKKGNTKAVKSELYPGHSIIRVLNRKNKNVRIKVVPKGSTKKESGYGLVNIIKGANVDE